MKTYNVPDELIQDFEFFLDVSQSRFTTEDINNLSEKERKVFNLIRSWIKQPSYNTSTNEKKDRLDRIQMITWPK